MAKTRFKNKKYCNYCCVSGSVHSGISSHTSFTLFLKLTLQLCYSLGAS